MISIIERISITRSDDNDSHWYDLEIVPATGEIETSTKTDTQGKTKTTTLKVKVKELHPYISDNLKVRIYATNRAVLELGTIDVPVIFEVKESSIIEISFEYKTKA